MASRTQERLGDDVREEGTHTTTRSLSGNVYCQGRRRVKCDVMTYPLILDESFTPISVGHNRIQLHPLSAYINPHP